jgi:hypothetical protein
MERFDATISVDIDELLADLRSRGLAVTLETPGRHWHLAYPDRPGTLELTADGNEVQIKVHPKRDGGWAQALAAELASRTPRSRPSS